MDKSLVIVQPYVPHYRVEFFERLIADLGKDGIGCRVLASVPSGSQRDRGDAADADWIVRYKPRQIQVAGRTLGIGGAHRLWAGADGVIVGHLGSSMDTYLALNDSRKGRLRAGLWGHIKSYVSAGNPLDLALEKWQLRQADHVFAYTPGGTDYALRAGIDSGKVTSVMNATDTSGLESAIDRVGTSQVQEFLGKHSIVPAKTLAYVGGIDEGKRIDFLAIALEELWRRDSSIRILVAGRGRQADLLDAAVDRGQAIMLGYADHELLALLSTACAGILIPGRIGLVAVDALVLGLPILTTDWPYHAPEAEYLREGISLHTAKNNVGAFVDLICQHVNHNDAHSFKGRREAWEYPTIEAMVRNFSEGVRAMLAERPYSAKAR